MGNGGVQALLALLFSCGQFGLGYLQELNIWIVD